MTNPLRSGSICAATLAAILAFPTQSASDEKRVDRMIIPSNSVHTGAATYNDQQMASDLVAAFTADRMMSGTTVTVVVGEGRITLSGSARDVAQAARAEQIAADIAGIGNVEGKLDIQGG